MPCLEAHSCHRRCHHHHHHPRCHQPVAPTPGSNTTAATGLMEAVSVPSSLQPSGWHLSNMVSMVAGIMVAGSIRIMVPAGIIAMGGRAMAGTGVEQTCHGVALALQQAFHGVALQQTCHGVRLYWVALQNSMMIIMPPMMQMMAQKSSSHEEALIQHTEFGEPTTGCRLPFQWWWCWHHGLMYRAVRPTMNLESLLQDAGSLFSMMMMLE